MWRYAAACCILLALSVAGHGAPVVVVGEGTRATIVLPAEAAGDETIAARELAIYVEKMTGRVLPVVREGSANADVWDPVARAFTRAVWSDTGAPAVHVGRTSVVEALLGEELAQLDQDGYLLRAQNGDLLIAGATPWATRFAAYGFLEDHCGVRWYLPGEIGTVIPRHAELAFANLNDRQEPVFLMRQFSGVLAEGKNEIGRANNLAWQDYNRLRGRYRFHHNLYRLLDPTVYGAEHPEWFPFIDGQRRPPRVNSSSGWQPCMTAEGGIRRIADNIIETFDNDPELNSVSIAPNDGGGYCNCPDCLALSENVGTPFENRSRVFWPFANRIAELVAEKYPDKIIGTLAYSYSRFPYEGLTLHPNIMPFYVGTSAVYRDEAQRREREEHIAEWGRVASRLGIYEWYFGDGFAIPDTYSRILARSLRQTREHQAQAMYSETYPNWGLDGYKVWIFAKLLWNPDRDVEELLDDFANRFFAEAAEPMRAFIELCERQGELDIGVMDPETDEKDMWLFRKADQFVRFPPDVIEEAQIYLDEAKKAATTDLTRRRVNYIAESFAVTHIMANRYNAAAEALSHLESADGIGPALSALARTAIPEYNLDLYYRWVLADDRWQVRYPHDGLHTTHIQARTVLSSLLAKLAMERVKDQPRITPEDVQAALAQVSREALGGRELTVAEKSLLDETANSAGRVAVAHRTARPPVIDGTLADACWQHTDEGEPVRTYGNFSVLRVGGPARFHTEFRLCHDGEYLYMGVEARQAAESFKVMSIGRDGRVWDDDGIEILLNEPQPQGPKDYFQVILNTEPTPNIFDMLGGDASWDGDIVAAATTRPGEGFTIEVRIPLRQIGLDPAVNRLLKLNVVRNVAEEGHGMQEISNWFPTYNANADLASRGWLVLE